MRVLVVTPLMREPDGRPRLFGRALQSIYSLRWPCQLDHYHQNGGDDYSDGNGTVTRKFEEARQRFLDGGYDAMLCAESDMIVPADGLERLAALDTDIAYGLYVWRHGKPQWSAYTRVEHWQGRPLSLHPEQARQAWGQCIEVKGIGQGFTLIKRHVLENLHFRNWKGVSCDWALAIDAQEAGYQQVCDLGCVCGHMALTPSPRVLWPDPNEAELYRTEFLG